jgi:thiol-disulfide isomerase/thioredoxin
MMARCALLCLVVMAAVRSEDDVAAEKNAEEKPAEDTSAVDPKNSGKKAGRDAKSGHTYPEDSACIILTNENFDKVLVTQGPLFVKFYDPHCGHCKQLMPTWEAVAKEVNPPEGSAPIYPNRIACMDCVTNKAKCDQLPKISGFPKFKIVGINTQNQAQILEYKGVREEKQLMHYAKTVGDIDEQRKIQADSEDTVKIEKRKRWKVRITNFISIHTFPDL